MASGSALTNASPSCLAKSTVNAVISKRFAKRQQMRWTKRGAHLLLQSRTRTLDGTLRPLSERWCPGLANENENEAAQAPRGVDTPQFRMLSGSTHPNSRPYPTA